LNRLEDALLAAQNSSQATPTVESEVKHEAEYVSDDIVIKAKTVPGWSTLVEINLVSIETSDNPGWSLSWIHHPDYLLDFLPDYLRKWCPAGEEMIDALEELALDNFTKETPPLCQQLRH
jgi:hypothetical protein